MAWMVIYKVVSELELEGRDWSRPLVVQEVALVPADCLFAGNFVSSASKQGDADGFENMDFTPTT